MTVTEKGGIITCTLTNRSYDQKKSFFLPKCAEVDSAVLYSGEGVVHGTRFRESTLVVATEGEHYCVILPEHSIAVVKLHT